MQPTVPSAVFTKLSFGAWGLGIALMATTTQQITNDIKRNETYVHILRKLALQLI